MKRRTLRPGGSWLIAPWSRWRARRREGTHLLIVTVIASLGICLASWPTDRPWYWGTRLGGALGLGLLGLHCLLCLTGFSGDEALLPLCGYLCALSLIILTRKSLPLALRQLRWILLGLGLIPWAALPRRWTTLAEYRYLAGVVGFALLLFTALFGKEQGGARLWLAVGGGQFQPGELVRLLLGVFLAAIFSENAELFAHPTARVGPVDIPEPRYLVPLLIMLVLFVFVLVVQKDLGSALLYYSLFMCIGFAATGQMGYLVLPGILGCIGGSLALAAFPHVRTRFDIWLDPWTSALGPGYQIVQSMFALANGGWFGLGLGKGYAHLIPAVYTDLPLTILGEELGFAGLLAALAGQFLLAGRGLAIAHRCGQEFLRLLGISIAVGWWISTFLATGGMLRLVPLTGLVTPFVSYGGTAMVSNLVCLGLLLNISRQELWQT